jgi:hypothetical protein
VLVPNPPASDTAGLRWSPRIHIAFSSKFLNTEKLRLRLLSIFSYLQKNSIITTWETRFEFRTHGFCEAPLWNVDSHGKPALAMVCGHSFHFWLHLPPQGDCVHLCGHAHVLTQTLPTILQQQPALLHLGPWDAHRWHDILGKYNEETTCLGRGFWRMGGRRLTLQTSCPPSGTWPGGGPLKPKAQEKPLALEPMSSMINGRVHAAPQAQSQH